MNLAAVASAASHRPGGEAQGPETIDAAVGGQAGDLGGKQAARKERPDLGFEGDDPSLSPLGGATFTSTAGRIGKDDARGSLVSLAKLSASVLE
jgi:hypothetical protein